MTPDELVREIMRIQQERDPDGDPGDLEITVQDDSRLVTVYQPHWADTEIEGVLTPGGSIQQALELHLEMVRDGE